MSNDGDWELVRTAGSLGTSPEPAVPALACSSEELHLTLLTGPDISELPVEEGAAIRFNSSNGSDTSAVLLPVESPHSSSSNGGICMPGMLSWHHDSHSSPGAADERQGGAPRMATAASHGCPSPPPAASPPLVRLRLDVLAPGRCQSGNDKLLSTQLLPCLSGDQQHPLNPETTPCVLGDQQQQQAACSSAGVAACPQHAFALGDAASPPHALGDAASSLHAFALGDAAISDSVSSVSGGGSSDISGQGPGDVADVSAPPGLLLCPPGLPLLLSSYLLGGQSGDNSSTGGEAGANATGGGTSSYVLGGGQDDISSAEGEAGGNVAGGGMPRSEGSWGGDSMSGVMGGASCWGEDFEEEWEVARQQQQWQQWGSREGGSDAGGGGGGGGGGGMLGKGSGSAASVRGGGAGGVGGEDLAGFGGELAGMLRSSSPACGSGEGDSIGGGGSADGGGGGGGAGGGSGAGGRGGAGGGGGGGSPVVVMVTKGGDVIEAEEDALADLMARCPPRLQALLQRGAAPAVVLDNIGNNNTKDDNNKDKGDNAAAPPSAGRGPEAIALADLVVDDGERGEDGKSSTRAGSGGALGALRGTGGGNSAQIVSAGLRVRHRPAWQAADADRAGDADEDGALWLTTVCDAVSHSWRRMWCNGGGNGGGGGGCSRRAHVKQQLHTVPVSGGCGGGGGVEQGSGGGGATVAAWRAALMMAGLCGIMLFKAMVARTGPRPSSASSPRSATAAGGGKGSLPASSCSAQARVPNGHSEIAPSPTRVLYLTPGAVQWVCETDACEGLTTAIPSPMGGSAGGGGDGGCGGGGGGGGGRFSMVMELPMGQFVEIA